MRLARNQSLFRTLNEKLQIVNESLSSMTETFVIACECADTSCVEMLEITPTQYEDVRAHPRRFAVLAQHVVPDIEVVVAERSTHVVVEKVGAAGELAEQIAP